MEAVHTDSAGVARPEYDVHSLYGYTESVRTRVSLEKLRGERAFVLSRSTFANSGSPVFSVYITLYI